MKTIQIFVVFHKLIFDTCYENIPQEDLDKYFTFIAVNKDIEKIYTPNKYKIINEWELPIYDNNFQEKGYNENSAMYHVYINDLHVPYDYIGFFQYDMKFNNDIIKFLHTNIDATPNVYFPFLLYDYNFCCRTCDDDSIMEGAVQEFKLFHDVEFDKTIKFPLYNTYVIPKSLYEKTMKWVVQLYDKLYPLLQNSKHQNKGHIGTVYERVMAFSLAQEKLPHILLNIQHNHDLKNLAY